MRRSGSGLGFRRLLSVFEVLALVLGGRGAIRDDRVGDLSIELGLFIRMIWRFSTAARHNPQELSARVTRWTK